MSSRCCYQLGMLAIAGGLLGACQATSSPDATFAEDAPNISASAPIWVPVDSPKPLPRVLVMGGTSQVIDIADSVPGQITNVEVVKVNDAPTIYVGVREGTQLDVTAPQGSEEQGVADLRVTTADGREHMISFPVASQTKPMKHVTFNSNGKSKPKKVFLAGRFNNWNASATALDDSDGDGVWEASVPIDPGVWPYKFVVDGQWTLDPDNPDTMDDGGHENSKMVVEGSSKGGGKPLAIAMLPAGAPGVGRQGGFTIQLAEGRRLDPANVRVFVDNQPLPKSSYTLDETKGIVSLNVPASDWKSQQFVSITASDTNGSSGTFLAPFEFSDSPREPKDEVIYYIVVDRFKNGDTANDGPVDDPELIPITNYAGGDFAGVTQMIDEGYFDDLGVTTLWISPPFDQPDIAMRDSQPPNRKFTGFHGYWPVDMRNTEERWGTMDDFKEMVDTAHEHGLAVIIDFVSNHVHMDAPIAKEHPEWFSKLELPDGTRNIRQYDEHPFTTWFDVFIPDIDYSGQPAATEYMTDSAVWWIKETGADGFRHDAVKHVPLVFWEMCTRKLNEQITKPQGKRLYQVGETISSRSTINQFVGPELLDGQFDFPLLWAIKDAFAWERSSLKDVAKSLQESVDQYPPGATMSPLLGNHDVPRFMGCAEFDNEPGKDKEAEEEAFTNPAKIDDVKSYQKLQLGFAFLLTIPGAPMMYYGDEIGMTGSGDPDNRRFFTPANEWNNENKTTYDVVKSLLHARKNSFALRRGAYQLLSVDDETLVFARVSPQETALVVIQRHGTPSGGKLAVQLPEEWGKPAVFEPLSLNNLTQADASLSSSGMLEVSSKPYSSGVWRLIW